LSLLRIEQAGVRCIRDYLERPSVAVQETRASNRLVLGLCVRIVRVGGGEDPNRARVACLDQLRNLRWERLQKDTFRLRKTEFDSAVDPSFEP